MWSFVTQLGFRQRILTSDLRLISALLHQLRQSPDLSTSLDFSLQTFLVSISQHPISLMESSSSTALLQNATGITISGNAQVINAGGNVVLHGPLHAAGTSKFYKPSIPFISLMMRRSSQLAQACQQCYTYSRRSRPSV